jgi:hypothetical protein
MSLNIGEFGKALIKNLGMSEIGECTGRKGIVYIKIEGSDPRPMAYSDEDMKHPVVCECEHDALRMIVTYLTELFPMLVMASLIGVKPKVVQPDNFLYVYTEDTTEEVEIHGMEEAMSVLKFCKDSNHGHP